MSAIPSEQAIQAALSLPRLSTYLAATQGTPALAAAVKLYAWNAQISAAMLNPLHCCEVVVRNAVSDALEAVYGPSWPWDQTFVLSLLNPKKPAFNPRAELIRARKGLTSTGKVIAELKFVFWQSMFTGRFDGRVWIPHLKRVLPHYNKQYSVQIVRKSIRDDLEQLRLLRNRIAHHEPIFKRPLASDLQIAEKLIGYRCPVTAAWMMAHQSATSLVGNQPP